MTNPIDFSSRHIFQHSLRLNSIEDFEKLLDRFDVFVPTQNDLSQDSNFWHPAFEFHLFKEGKNYLVKFKHVGQTFSINAQKLFQIYEKNCPYFEDPKKNLTILYIHLLIIACSSNNFQQLPRLKTPIANLTEEQFNMFPPELKEKGETIREEDRQAKEIEKKAKRAEQEKKAIDFSRSVLKKLKKGKAIFSIESDKLSVSLTGKNPNNIPFKKKVTFQQDKLHSTTQYSTGKVELMRLASPPSVYEEALQVANESYPLESLDFSSSTGFETSQPCTVEEFEQSLLKNIQSLFPKWDNLSKQYWLPTFKFKLYKQGNTFEFKFLDAEQQLFSIDPHKLFQIYNKECSHLDAKSTLDVLYIQLLSHACSENNFRDLPSLTNLILKLSEEQISRFEPRIREKFEKIRSDVREAEQAKEDKIVSDLTEAMLKDLRERRATCSIENGRVEVTINTEAHEYYPLAGRPFLNHFNPLHITSVDLYFDKDKLLVSFRLMIGADFPRSFTCKFKAHKPSFDTALKIAQEINNNKKGE